MFDSDDPIMLSDDRVLNAAQINAYLAAYAHLTSHGCPASEYGSHDYDFWLREIPRLTSVKMSVETWLRPKFRANDRSLRSVTLTKITEPDKHLRRVIRRWCFEHIRADNDSVRDDICAGLSLRILKLRPWTELFSVETKPRTSSSWTEQQYFLGLDDVSNVGDETLFVLGFEVVLEC